MDMGHWEFDREFNVDDWFGFVYRIIDLDTGQEYIGKKQFKNTIRKRVKNRKNRKTVRSESNWREYTSSSTHVNNAIEERGKHKFRFIIESLHKSKGSLTYAEVSKQIHEDVLRARLSDGETPAYYNKQVSAIKYIPPQPLKEELEMIVDDDFRKKILKECQKNID